MKKYVIVSLLLSFICTLTSCTTEPTRQQHVSAPMPSSTATMEIAENSTFTVHYIDVGQADASLVLCDGEAMLIDGGNVADSNLIAAYLNKLNITCIDYIVCTHAHEDHVGGLSGALSVAQVKNVLAPKTEASTKAYQNFKRKAEEQGLTIKHPLCGDTFNLGSSTAKILGPVSETDKKTNNTSIVLKITYGSTSFLFTGDAETEEEHELIDSGAALSADVLKVGHHGSDTSTSYVWLREIMPKFAVISVGKNNYGQPSEAVLSRLNDAGAEILRTDMLGDIIIQSDGVNVSKRLY